MNKENELNRLEQRKCITQKSKKCSFMKAYEKDKSRLRIFADFSQFPNCLQTIYELLEVANNKTYGRRITFEDLVVFAVSRIAKQELQTLQEYILTSKDKIIRSHDEYNSKHKLDSSIYEFIARQLELH